MKYEYISSFCANIILVAEFYCIFLHIAIDLMKRNGADEHIIFSIVCEECKDDQNILLDALKMNIDNNNRKPRYTLRTPFQHLIKDESARVNFILPI